MALSITVTNAGRIALINAANTGTAAVTIASVGLSANTVSPLSTTTALTGEFKRLATLSGDVVADDTIHLILRDESTDVFTVRSLALYLADGTLFAIYGQADVIAEKSAMAMLLLAIDVQFADINANSLTFGNANFLNPPATSTTEGVVELATQAETIAGTDARRAVVPRSLKLAVTQWINDRFGIGAPTDYIRTLLVAANAAAARLTLGLKSAALKDEGAGKGLDADMLDGQHGSYYSNIVARLGYTPWGPHNDGAGSGLDADMLAGQQADYYTDITARLGYTPVNAAGGFMSGDLVLRYPIPTIHLRSTAGMSAFIRNDNNNLYVLRGNIDASTWTAVGGAWPLTINLATNDAIFGGILRAAGNLYARSSSLVWDMGNDGAGSGLDADLLDGQQGSYYANIIARLGYAPWGPNNDGAGSGLDADLLDGQDSGYYSNIVARLGFTPVRQGGGAGQGANLVQIGWSGARLKAQVDTIDLGNIAFDSHLADVWRASNDGAGSGLDADLLDGFHADAFVKTTDVTDVWRSTNDGAGSGLDADLLDGFHADAFVKTADVTDMWRASNDGAGSGLDADLLDGFQSDAFAKMADFSNNLSPAGYQRLPNGLILQWCITQVQQSIESTAIATFPIQFPNAVLDVQLTTRVASHSIENDMWYQLVGDPTLANCIVARARSDGDGDGPSYCRIFAIGR